MTSKHCRLFTRVDGAVVNIRDQRIFHVFGSDRLYMDVLWQSQDMRSKSVCDNDTAVGAFQETSRFPLGNSLPTDSKTVFRKDRLTEEPTEPSIAAIPPNKVRDPNAWSRVLPDVTSANSIHKNFELLL